MGSLTIYHCFISIQEKSILISSKVVSSYFHGSLLGAWVVNFVSPELLKPLVLVLLIAVAIYTILKKNWGHESTYQKLSLQKALLFSFTIFAIGFYDGFLGGWNRILYIICLFDYWFRFFTLSGKRKISKLRK